MTKVLLSLSCMVTLEVVPSPFSKPLSMSDLLTVAAIDPGGGGDAHPMERRWEGEEILGGTSWGGVGHMLSTWGGMNVSVGA
jgi:hypothetical protein